MNKRELGGRYETLACEKLEEDGINILARNYRVKIGEIDIIGIDVDTLVFVEVKYRKNTDYGGAEYAIPLSKQKTIRRVAEWFMKERGYKMSTYCRFDAVLIDGDYEQHIKNAW